MININKIEESILVTRLERAHNCWSDCVENAQEMQDAIAKWRPFIDRSLLTPEGYKTPSVAFLNGNDIGNETKSFTVDVTSQIGSATSIQFQARLVDSGETNRLFIEEIDLQTSSPDGVVIMGIIFYIDDIAMPANTFSFVGDVISAPGTQNGGISKGAGSVMVLDKEITNPNIHMVINQLRPY